MNLKNISLGEDHNVYPTFDTVVAFKTIQTIKTIKGSVKNPLKL